MCRSVLLATIACLVSVSALSEPSKRVIEAGAPLCPSVNALYGIRGVSGSAYLAQHVAARMGCVTQDARREISAEQVKPMSEGFVSLALEGTVLYTLAKYVRDPSAKASVSSASPKKPGPLKRPLPASVFQWYQDHGWTAVPRRLAKGELPRDVVNVFVKREPGSTEQGSAVSVLEAQVADPGAPLGLHSDDDVAGSVIVTRWWLDCEGKRGQFGGNRLYDDYEMTELSQDEFQRAPDPDAWGKSTGAELSGIFESTACASGPSPAERAPASTP